MPTKLKTASTSPCMLLPLVSSARPSSDEPSSSTKNPIAGSSSSPAYPPASTSSNPRLAPVGSGGDGVFGHLAAKPDAPSAGKVFQEIEPPSYAEAVHDPTPPYIETTIISGFGEDGDVIIEGMPVGHFLAFFVNMMVSMSFDTIGFLLTALLATSHAAKHGSRAGLGITLIRYGFNFKALSIDDELEQYKYYDPDTPPSREDLQAQNEWTAYILFLLGFFMLFHANAEFLRIQRLKSIILASSEGSA
ncbi:hypothetical protein BJ742DRAFT_741835 [Cladochytrium replicatum]|nr:hypothetical protein BJ742DRAFT_741835 [Cladochytrium replicatum]